MTDHSQDRDDDTFALTDQAKLFLFYRDRGFSTADATDLADRMGRTLKLHGLKFGEPA